MIVLLAHGSPDERHRADVQVLATQVAQVLAPTTVRVAYLQHHGPTLTQAVADASPPPEAADERVWVLPLLLSAGVHVTEDVPAAVIEAAAERPDLDWRVLPTLPPATLALAVLALLPPVAGGAAAGRPRGVVGVVAGSSRAAALDSFETLASALRPAGVEVVCANGPGPQIGQAADLLSCLGAVEVTVVPLMFADGYLAARAVQVGRDLGLAAVAPVGQTLECAEALACWVAAHVSRATLAAAGQAHLAVHASR